MVKVGGHYELFCTSHAWPPGGRLPQLNPSRPGWPSQWSCPEQEKRQSIRMRLFAPHLLLVPATLVEKLHGTASERGLSWLQSKPYWKFLTRHHNLDMTNIWLGSRKKKFTAEKKSQADLGKGQGENEVHGWKNRMREERWNIFTQPPSHSKLCCSPFI